MANEKRLIDANDAIERAKNSDKIVGSSIWETGEVIEFLEGCPTVDAVEVVHGRWEVIEASDELYKCSACGEWQYIPEEHFAYCPYCGAKMDGGNEGGV